MNFNEYKEQRLSSFKKRNLYTKLNITLLDKIVVVRDSTILEGIVTMINLKGCQIMSDSGQYFIKWCDIISTIK